MFIFFLICLLAVCNYGITNSIVENGANNHKIKVAVCYWGLTRSAFFVCRSQYKGLFKVLKANNIDYDVFMHTWRLKGKQRVWEKEVDTPPNYNEYKVFSPKYYKIENQDDFTDNLDFSKYFYKEIADEFGISIDAFDVKGEWPPRLVFNHLCALESQKRVTDMVIESGNKYDLVIYVRPDALFKNALKVQDFLELKDNEIVIPNFGHYGGYNDRFAILTYKTAPIYGKRIDQIAKFRKERERIHAEVYVKYICETNKLNVVFTELLFYLVRPNGYVMIP